MKKERKSCINCKLFRIFAASKRNKDMEIDVKYLPEAAEFMLSIDKAAAKKLTYNIGKGITYSTIVRAFRALGAQTASLDLGSLGRVALW